LEKKSFISALIFTDTSSLEERSSVKSQNTHTSSIIEERFKS